VLDLLRVGVHYYTRDVTAAGDFIYVGSLDLSEFMAINDYNDIRALAASVLVSNETSDAGSSVVSGHAMSVQLTSLDDPGRVTESSLRKRALFGVQEGSNPNQALRDIFVPTERSIVPRTALENGSIRSGEDHVLMFETGESAGSARSLDDGALAQGEFMLDLNVDNPTTSVAKGVHYLPPRYSGPVVVAGSVRPTVSDSGAIGLTVKVYRLDPTDGTESAVNSVNFDIEQDANAVAINMRDDSDGIISRITIENSDSTTSTLANNGNLRVVFEGGNDSFGDCMVFGWFGASGAQSIRFKGTLALDAEPGEGRYLEQPPPPCVLTKGEFALAVRPLTMAKRGKMMHAQAASFRGFLDGAAKVGKNIIKGAEAVLSVGEKAALLGLL
jgi:hypothetical protein